MLDLKSASLDDPAENALLLVSLFPRLVEVSLRYDWTSTPARYGHGWRPAWAPYGSALECGSIDPRQLHLNRDRLEVRARYHICIYRCAPHAVAQVLRIHKTVVDLEIRSKVVVKRVNLRERRHRSREGGTARPRRYRRRRHGGHLD